VLGRGNWIWFIPLKTEAHRNMVSVGITWRPDIYRHDVRSVDDFKAHVAKEHPWIVRLVESGTPTDVSTYRNYLYFCRQVYSPDRWFIVGDAANAVDPMYSTGMMYTTLALRQVGAVIGADLEGKLDPQFVLDLAEMYRIQLEAIQDRITRLYEVMHDPYQAHLSMHWDTNDYMHMYLPLLSKGLLWNPRFVKRFISQPQFSDAEAENQRRAALFQKAAATVKNLSIDDILYLYTRSANYDFDINNCDAPKTMAKGLGFRGMLRARLLLKARGRGFGRQAPAMLRDLTASVALRLVGMRALEQ
jgi:flavin-dependent dehydrogenase